MEEFDMKTREHDFKTLEEPSKENDYTCTCQKAYSQIKWILN